MTKWWTTWEWRILLILYALIACCFFAPFVERATEGDAARYTGYDLLEGKDAAMVQALQEDGTLGAQDARKALLDESGAPKPDLRIPFGVLLLLPVVGLGMTILDRYGKSKHWAGLIVCLAGVALSAWMMHALPAQYHLPDGYAAEATPVFTDRILFSIRAMPVLYGLGFALSCLGASRRYEKREIARMSARLITRVSVLSAIASVLFLIPGIPIIPPIYKLDFSTIPALLGGFSMGWGAGLWIVLIKALVGMTNSTTVYVGELADFLMSGSFVVLASIVYGRRRTFKGALAGMLAGIGAMAVVGALTNYLILIPFFITAFHMPLDAIVQLIAGTIPAVDNMFTLILYAVVPFNLIKGAALCIVTLILYKRVSPLLKSSS